MTHDELVKTINIALAPIDLQFARVEDEPDGAVLVLSRQPGFDEERSDDELASLIRKRLDVEPTVAEATQNLDISLE